MKIYVSPHYRTAMWGCTISLFALELMVLYSGFSTIELIKLTLTTNLSAFLLCIIIPIFILLTLFLLVWRLLLHTKINEEGYQSYLGKRKMCFVDKKKQIYFSLYKDPFYREENNYIAFSNEVFETKYYLTGWRTFGSAYNAKKIIVLPYNRDTMIYFNISNWIDIEMQYPEKKNKRK